MAYYAGPIALDCPLSSHAGNRLQGRAGDVIEWRTDASATACGWNHPPILDDKAFVAGATTRIMRPSA